MDSSLYTTVEKSVSWVERRARKPAKASEDTTVSRQGHGLCILHGILLIDFLPKGQTINNDYYIALLNPLEDAINKKRPHMAKKKPLFQQDHVHKSVHKSMKTMVKLNDLRFELLPDPLYSPDLARSELFADLKKMLQGKRFSSDDEVIAAAEAYFDAKHKSFYKKGIESLEKRWNDCIAIEGDYVDE